MGCRQNYVIIKRMASLTFVLVKLGVHLLFKKSIYMSPNEIVDRINMNGFGMTSKTDKQSGTKIFGNTNCT